VIGGRWDAGVDFREVWARKSGRGKDKVGEVSE
jgi:hypothetical protein